MNLICHGQFLIATPNRTMAHLIHKFLQLVFGYVHEPHLGRVLEGLPDGQGWGVDVELLHIARDPREGLLDFRMTLHPDLALDVATCSRVNGSVCCKSSLLYGNP